MENKSYFLFYVNPPIVRRNNSDYFKFDRVFWVLPITWLTKGILVRVANQTYQMDRSNRDPISVY